MKATELNQSWIKNSKLQKAEPKTIRRYIQLQEQSRTVKCQDHHCFFALKGDDMDKKKKEAGIKEGEKIYSVTGGLYGTEDGIKSYFEALGGNEETIRRECNPYEVYLYEFDNYECNIDTEGDYRAIAKVTSIYGEEIAEMIPRKRAYYDFNRVYKEMARDSR